VKGFKTLFWLEYRRSGAWAVALIGSLAFWAWALFQARAVDPVELSSVRTVLLVIAAAVGALVPALMIGRLRGETRGGQYQVLLLTPPSGAAHIAARYAFALGTAAVYFGILGGLAWWVVGMAGLTVDASTAAQLVLGLPLYVVGTTIAPILAWTVLLTVFVSAYRIAGPGWIPGTVMVVGTPFALRWLFEGIARAAYSLPGWPILGSLGVPEGAYMTASPDGHEPEIIVDGIVHIPQEPLWIMLALTLVLLVIASRIWREVEA